jgi:hypothetical protein
MKHKKLIFYLTHTINGAKTFKYQKVGLESFLIVLIIALMGKDGSDDFLVPLSLVELSKEVRVVSYQ